MRRFETRGYHSPEKPPKVPWEVPIVRKEEWKRSGSPSHESLPQLSSPRSHRSGGMARLDGILLPSLSPSGSPRGTRSPKVSPKMKRAGGHQEKVPWIDESGNLQLPPKYRDFASLTPREIGVLTAVACRR